MKPSKNERVRVRIVLIVTALLLGAFASCRSIGGSNAGELDRADLTRLFDPLASIETLTDQDVADLRDALSPIIRARVQARVDDGKLSPEDRDAIAAGIDALAEGRMAVIAARPLSSVLDHLGLKDEEIHAALVLVDIGLRRGGVEIPQVVEPDGKAAALLHALADAVRVTQ